MSAELFDYGIHTENSDIRAHVSVVNRTIYAFETARGVEAVKKHNPPEKYAGQPGVEGHTARGWILKPAMIEGLRSLAFHSWTGWEQFSQEMSTSQKGHMAVKCVCDCMRIGRFPFWINSTEDDRENVQIKGVDIVVFCRKKIQVKCDWYSGPPPGTGNLFLQSAERNPNKMT